MEANATKAMEDQVKDDEVRSQFRIPGKVYDWLKHKAEQERRSINKQLVVELEAAKEAGQAKEPA